MAFTIPEKQPAARPPELLQPAPDPDTRAPYDQVAPGLYPGETVVRLDTGDLVAVAVETRRITGGGGMAFRGWARAIEEDGRTRLDSAHQEIELQFTHSAAAAVLAKLATDDLTGDEVISREIMLMMLGEPATMVPLEVDPSAAAPDPETLPSGTVVDHTAREAPQLAISDEARTDASIRHALDLAARATPEVDVRSLLAR